MDTERIIELIRRAPVLKVLQQEGTVDRRELEHHLSVSKSTVHRFTRSLREHGLIERSGDEFVLTPLGEMSIEEVTTFKTSIETLWELAPVLEVVSANGIEINVAALADATVTIAEPGNPYRPVNRFMSLMSETNTLCGLDPASINPLHIDEIYERIVTGMKTNVVFRPAIVEELLLSNPKRAQTAFESGNLTIRTHEDLPFGLTLYDDRMGVGIYGEEMGLLRMYVDTDAPAAYEWAEEIYTNYWDNAIALTEHTELSQLPPVQVLQNDD